MNCSTCDSAKYMAIAALSTITAIAVVAYMSSTDKKTNDIANTVFEERSQNVDALDLAPPKLKGRSAHRLEGLDLAIPHGQDLTTRENEIEAIQDEIRTDAITLPTHHETFPPAPFNLKHIGQSRLQEYNTPQRNYTPSIYRKAGTIVEACKTTKAHHTAVVLNHTKFVMKDLIKGLELETAAFKEHSEFFMKALAVLGSAVSFAEALTQEGKIVDDESEELKRDFDTLLSILEKYDDSEDIRDFAQGLKAGTLKATGIALKNRLSKAILDWILLDGTLSKLDELKRSPETEELYHTLIEWTAVLSVDMLMTAYKSDDATNDKLRKGLQFSKALFEKHPTAAVAAHAMLGKVAALEEEYAPRIPETATRLMEEHDPVNDFSGRLQEYSNEELHEGIGNIGSELLETLQFYGNAIERNSISPASDRVRERHMMAFTSSAETFQYTHQEAVADLRATPMRVERFLTQNFANPASDRVRERHMMAFTNSVDDQPYTHEEAMADLQKIRSSVVASAKDVAQTARDVAQTVRTIAEKAPKMNNHQREHLAFLQTQAASSMNDDFSMD